MLRERVVAELRRRLAFEWYVFVLTDPRTAVGVDPLADVPPGLDLPSQIRAKYLTPVQRWTSLRHAAHLGGQRAESEVWRRASAHGVADIASVVFRDGHGCWGFLDLWSSGTFSTRDTNHLDEVTPAVTASLRRCQAESLRQRSTVPVEGAVVVLLDGELRLRGRTTQADDWLSRLLPAQGGRPVVPAVAHNVGAQLLAVEAGVDRADPAGRVHLGAGAWVTVRAARLGPDEIAVSMEPIVAGERTDLVGRAFGLSPRERTVLDHLCSGAPTAAIAAALHLSPLTVQDHVKSVFERTGVRTRGELVALAVGGPVLS